MSTSEKGAVTAEFVLLWPTILLGLAGVGFLFQLGLARLELSLLAFQQARALVVSGEVSTSGNASLHVETDSRWVCVSATRQMAFEVSETACFMRHGS
ncbi:MAG: hypothetical protein RL068_841 [Actinomycetota bacterium]